MENISYNVCDDIANHHTKIRLLPFRDKPLHRLAEDLGVKFNVYIKYVHNLLIISDMVSIFHVTLNTHPLVGVLCHKHLVVQDTFLYA